MRAAFFTAALVATAFLSSPVAAADDYVKTVEEARAIAVDATTVRVRLGAADVLAAVVERAPGIETLVIDHPGNALDKAALPLLARLPALTSLTIGGDAFLYDDEFAALGRLSHLKELSLHLPWPSFTEARLASLGGLTSLETLDMEGCRGDTEELEKAVWANVKARRALTKVVATDDATKEARRAELLVAAKRLRELARELLEKARELEEATGR